MRFYFFFCTLWIAFSIISATQSKAEERPMALSFVFSHDGYYELEDIPALLNRSKDRSMPIEKQKFYFSYMIFACPGSSDQQLQIERSSTTGIVSFVQNVVLAQYIHTYIYNIPVCKKKFRPKTIALKLVNGLYTVDKGKEKSNRQEYSIGYEISDNQLLLQKYRLPVLNSFYGMEAGTCWLEAFRVIYDTERMVVKQIFYELHYLGQIRKVPAECHDYDKDSKLIKNISFKRVYNHAQQNTALREAERPTRRLSLEPGQPSTSYTAPSGSSSQALKSEESSQQYGSGFQQSQTQSINYSQPMDTNDENDPMDANALQSIKPEPMDSYDQNVDTDTQSIQAVKPEMTSDEQCCLDVLLNFPSSVKPIPVQPVGIPKKRRTPVDDKPSTSVKRAKTPQPDDHLFKVPPSREPPVILSEEFFKRQQLAPIEYFDVSIMQAATCTYLNVAPMWQSLADGAWDKVDLAIRNVLDVIKTLRVIAGTHETLTLPPRVQKSNSKKTDQPIDNTPQEIYFQSYGYQIAVPRLFYKMIVHKVFPPGYDTKPYLYAIIIVMHNQLTKPTPDEMICEQDYCAFFGWNVSNDDEQTGSPYCCYPSDEILKKLDIRYPRITGVLNLNSVVVGIDEHGVSIVRDYNKKINGQNAVYATEQQKTKLLGDILGNSNDDKQN